MSDWSSDGCSSELDQMVAAVEALGELATLTNDTVIEPHAERLTALLEQVRPLLGRLAERSDILATLIVDLGRFVERCPKAVHNGTVLMLAWLYPDVGGLLGQGTGQDPLRSEERRGGTACVST